MRGASCVGAAGAALTLFCAPLAAQAGLKLSGFGEASYVYSNNAVAGGIVGRLYDRYSNAFSLNALKLVVDRPFDPKKVDAGVHGDLIIGQNAAVLQSTGFSVGPNADMTQLYVTLNLPTANGNGVQIKLGKLVTFMGLEVIEDVANPNWSEGNQFVYVENFTATGVEADFHPSSQLNLAFRLDNGWDRIVDTAGHKDFMGLIGLTLNANTTLTLVPYYGAQEDVSSAARYGLNLLLNQKVGPKTSVWVQGDYGKEKANAALPDPTQDADWWALGGWVATDLSPKTNLALRADYVDDAQAARTAGVFGVPAGAAHKFWSLTGTLNVKYWPNVLFRPELRYDHSSYTVFNGNSSQVTGAVSLAYSF